MMSKNAWGCLSCEIACVLAHSSTSDICNLVKEKSELLPRKKVFSSKGKNYPVSCKHCEDPKCVEACMAAALVFDEAKGMVMHDESRCVGCWMCVMACPYGAIRPNIKRKTPARCDKCKDKEEPACIKACPTGAVIWLEEIR